MRDVVAFATAGRPPEEREQIVQMIQQGAHEWAVHNFASGCEVGDMLVRRLDFGPGVRDALRFTFERWNGNGYPTGARGEAIPLAMRVVHLSHDMEAIGRLFSPAKALDAARERRDRTYDPELADLFVAHGTQLVRPARQDGAVGCRARPRAGTTPHPGRRRPRRRPHGGGGLHRPEIAVHGRPQPSMRAARRRRRPAARIHRGSHHRAPQGRAGARLRHDRRAELDLGQARRAHACGVRSRRASPDAHRADAPPLAGPGHAEPARVCAPREGRRVRLPQASARRCRRSRCRRPRRGGHLRGTHHRARRPSRRSPPRTPRPSFVGSHHKACSSSARPTPCSWRPATASRLRPRPAGRSTPAGSPVARSTCCASRRRDSRREQIADRLYISPKTADHHIQHVYTKIGVSTRAAAALWAMQHAVVR